MKSLFLTTALLFTAFTAFTAHAAALQPNSGLWWEEPVTGRFYAVEIAPSGRTFVVISEFDEQGRPSWRTMRGELTLANELEQAAGAPLATLRAPLQEITGPCPTCPVSAPDVRPSPLGVATIVFRSNAEAEFQQGAIRRPLRYFSPADQPLDFPSARLAGDYTMVSETPRGRDSRAAQLQPALDGACVRYEGSAPPARATRLRGMCPGNACESSDLTVLLFNLELAVGPGEHPALQAYRRSIAPEAIRPLSSRYVFPTLVYFCEEGYTRMRNPLTQLGDVCVQNNPPTVCTESHRVSEHAGTLRGLPLRSGEASFVLHPAR